MKKTIFYHSIYLGMLVIMVILLTACAGVSSTTGALPGESSRAEALPRTSSATTAPPDDMAETSDAVVTTPGAGGGLTYEEMRKNNPPPPLELKAQLISGGVRLDWVPAAVVTLPHAYSDTVIEYRVYRRAEGETDAICIGTSKELFYVDQTVEPGKTYRYSVSAVHEGPLEGERTDEVSILVP